MPLELGGQAGGCGLTWAPGLLGWVEGSAVPLGGVPLGYQGALLDGAPWLAGKE